MSENPVKTRTYSYWDTKTERIQNRCQYEMISKLQFDHLRRSDIRKGRIIPIFREMNGKDRDHSSNSYVQSFVVQSKLSKNFCIVDVHFIFDKLMGVPTWTRTTSMSERQDWHEWQEKERMSTDFLSRQVILYISLSVSRWKKKKISCTDISEYPARNGEWRQNVSSHVRQTSIFFVRATLHQRTCVDIRWVDHSSLRFLKSHLVVICFIVTYSMSLIFLFAFLLRCERNQTQPASIHGTIHGLSEWLNRVLSHLWSQTSRSEKRSNLNFTRVKISFEFESWESSRLRYDLSSSLSDRAVTESVRSFIGRRSEAWFWIESSHR